MHEHTWKFRSVPCWPALQSFKKDTASLGGFIGSEKTRLVFLSLFFHRRNNGKWQPPPISQALCSVCRRRRQRCRGTRQCNGVDKQVVWIMNWSVPCTVCLHIQDYGKMVGNNVWWLEQWDYYFAFYIYTCIHSCISHSNLRTDNSCHLPAFFRSKFI